MKKIITALLSLVILGSALGCKEVIKSPKPKKATIEFVNTDHNMEHVTFNGGYLRTDPEVVGSNIVCGLIEGSRGILYGKRRFNGKEWGKVTTREGLTGWYTPEVKSGIEDSKYLKLDKRNFQQSYPLVSGIDEKAAAAINGEIQKYLQVFNYVTGPVGSSLQCRVTCNKDNVLSILFTAPVINYRTYDYAKVQNEKEWLEVKRYCAVSPLRAMVASEGLTAAVSDLQYAMTFDLKDGKRLSLKDFSDKTETADLKGQGLIEENDLLEPTDFYIEGENSLIALVEPQEKDWGRDKADLSSIVTKKFQR